MDQTNELEPVLLLWSLRLDTYYYYYYYYYYYLVVITARRIKN